jgi:hypothetical protein
VLLAGGARARSTFRTEDGPPLPATNLPEAGLQGAEARPIKERARAEAPRSLPRPSRVEQGA